MKRHRALCHISLICRTVCLGIGFTLLGVASAHAEGIESCGMNHAMDSEALEYERGEIDFCFEMAETQFEKDACEFAYGDWQADLLGEWESFNYCMEHAVADCQNACPPVTDPNDPAQQQASDACCSACNAAASDWGW